VDAGAQSKNKARADSCKSERIPNSLSEGTCFRRVPDVTL
jgi:hypothetical protein